LDASVNPFDLIRRAALDEQTLVGVTLKARLDPAVPYRQIAIRPVQIRGEQRLQFSYFTEKQDITKNYKGAEAAQKLDEALALPYGSIAFQGTRGGWQAQVTKKGKVIMHRTPEAQSDTPPPIAAALAHDHEKALPLPVNQPDALLMQIGIMDDEGHIRPAMHAKFAQINEFLKLLEHTGVLADLPKDRAVELLDCGCGSAWLSFAAYHYLNDILGVPARLTGIDINGKLIEKDMQSATTLDYAGACFAQSAIIDYAPQTPPDILLALHACDTATDEALVQGLRAQSRLILCAPCCHHNLREQLDAADTPQPFAPVVRHGIIKQRMSELLTDSFRALILRIMGYKTDIVEFVSPEHTDKNLMIRAVRRDTPNPRDSEAALAEYEALKAFWQVTPYLETLLGAAFAPTPVHNPPATLPP